MRERWRTKASGPTGDGWANEEHDNGDRALHSAWAQCGVSGTGLGSFPRGFRWLRPGVSAENRSETANVGSRRNALAGRYDDCVLPGLYRRSPLFGGIITSERASDRSRGRTDGRMDRLEQDAAAGDQRVKGWRPTGLERDESKRIKSGYRLGERSVIISLDAANAASSPWGAT